MKNYLLASTSALLLWASWPPMPYTAPLLLGALVPLLLALENIITSSTKYRGRKAFWLSFLTFFLWNTSCIYWVFNALHAVMPTWIAVMISLIPFGLAPALASIAFWFYYQLRKRTSLFWSLTGLICLWITYEYLHQTWELAFPWMTLGNGFAETHQLVQWYEYTGVYGGTLWILLANSLIFAFSNSLLNQKSIKVLRQKARVALSVVVLPMVISLIIYYRYKETQRACSVVVVQPNIDPYEKFGPLPEFLQAQRLLRLSDSLSLSQTEYFIWPETALPQPIDEQAISKSLSALSIKCFLEKHKQGNIITGLSSYLTYPFAKTPSAIYSKDANCYYDNFNAAAQIENSSHVQFYHKSKLVPGVEKLPFMPILGALKVLFSGFGGATSSYGQQEHPTVFYSHNGVGVAPIICYESIWGAYVAESIKQGAQFIAIITNDGWWGNTNGKEQHLSYAKLRALETRRWVARSANTGISAFINQRGDIVQKTSWWVSTAIKASINLNEKTTFYTLHGDYIACLGCLGTLIIFAFLLVSSSKTQRHFSCLKNVMKR